MPEQDTEVLHYDQQGRPRKSAPVS